MVFSVRSTIAVMLMVGLAGTALGQTDPIKARRAIMKANGAAIGSLAKMAKMAKGETPFDADAAKAALQTMHNSTALADLFLSGSDQGDTNALPKIWADPAGFTAALDKLIATLDAQLANPPRDADGVKSTLGALGPACSGCHNAYRAPT